VPQAFHQAFSLQAFANPNLLFPPPTQLKNQWRVAATGAAPPTRRKDVTLARVGGSDRQLPLQSFLDFFLFLTILSVQAHPMESGPCTGHESGPAG
jgi:hypothetical protein